MNQKLKELLKEAYQAPVPERKQDFLRNIKYPKISYSQFILAQAVYIRKWVWVVSFAIFLVALIYGRFMDRNTLWILSSMMPFLAVSSITENIRSEVYGMTELEMASRFSLKSVVLARMEIIGMVHFIVLCFGTLSGYSKDNITIFQTGVYLLVPYLLTDAFGLWVTRKLHGKEAVYTSIGLAVMVSILPRLANYAGGFIYEADIFVWWLAALIILCGITILEWKKRIERVEELLWSL